MERPTCETCPYWDKTEQYGDEEHTLAVGSCCRGRPQLPPTDSLAKECGPAEGWWPETSNHNFCGEHPDFPAYLKSLRSAPGS